MTEALFPNPLTGGVEDLLIRLEYGIKIIVKSSSKII